MMKTDRTTRLKGEEYLQLKDLIVYDVATAKHGGIV